MLCDAFVEVRELLKKFVKNSLNALFVVFLVLRLCQQFVLVLEKDLIEKSVMCPFDLFVSTTGVTRLEILDLLPLSTLRPADDSRFLVCTFNQSDHLVLAHLGALVSPCAELVVTASHFLTEFSRRIQHDNVTEKATVIPAQYGNLSIVDWDDCGPIAWG